MLKQRNGGVKRASDSSNGWTVDFTALYVGTGINWRLHIRLEREPVIAQGFITALGIPVNMGAAINDSWNTLTRVPRVTRRGN